jgi:hypothetical protein
MQPVISANLDPGNTCKPTCTGVKYPYYCNTWKSDLCLHDTSDWEWPHGCDPEVYVWHCEWLCALFIVFILSRPQEGNATRVSSHSKTASARTVCSLLLYTVVAGSIPDGVIGIFQWHNPSGRTMALGSTQPLTEMSVFPGGKGGW